MNFSHRLLETISYATPSGKSNDGDLTYSTISTTRARITRQDNIVGEAGGEGLGTNIVVETEIELPVDTRVWLPGVSTSSINDSERVQTREFATTLDGTYTLYIAYM